MRPIASCMTCRAGLVELGYHEHFCASIETRTRRDMTKARRRASKRSRGECQSCDLPAVDGRPLCAGHLAARRAYDQARQKWLIGPERRSK